MTALQQHPHPGQRPWIPGVLGGQLAGWAGVVMGKEFPTAAVGPHTQRAWSPGQLLGVALMPAAPTLPACSEEPPLPGSPEEGPGVGQRPKEKCKERRKLGGTPARWWEGGRKTPGAFSEKRLPFK